MEKLVTYSVVPRKNPGNKMLPPKYYAQAQASGVMGIEEISERLQRECTLTRADIMAVLVGLEDVVADGISRGEIVRLGGLCSLQISLSSGGTDTEEEFNDALISKKRVLFRSGRTLRDAIFTANFKRVPKRPVVAKPAVPGPEDHGSSDSDGGLGA